MNDSTKILVVGWGGTVIVAVLVGIYSWNIDAIRARDEARRNACHHDGRLDHIAEGSTWRVRFQPSEDKTVILGVCKKCGRVTDLEQTGPSGFYMHWPLAGSPLYDEAIASGVENAADEGKPKKLSY